MNSRVPPHLCRNPTSDVGTIVYRPVGIGLELTKPDTRRVQVGSALQMSVSVTGLLCYGADPDIVQVGLNPIPRWNRPDAIPDVEHQSFLSESPMVAYDFVSITGASTKLRLKTNIHYLSLENSLRELVEPSSLRSLTCATAITASGWLWEKNGRLHSVAAMACLSIT